MELYKTIQFGITATTKDQRLPVIKMKTKTKKRTTPSVPTIFLVVALFLSSVFGAMDENGEINNVSAKRRLQDEDAPAASPSFGYEDSPAASPALSPAASPALSPAASPAYGYAYAYGYGYEYAPAGSPVAEGDEEQVPTADTGNQEPVTFTKAPVEPTAPKTSPPTAPSTNEKDEEPVVFTKAPVATEVPKTPPPTEVVPGEPVTFTKAPVETEDPKTPSPVETEAPKTPSPVETEAPKTPPPTAEVVTKPPTPQPQNDVDETESPSSQPVEDETEDTEAPTAQVVNVQDEEESLNATVAPTMGPTEKVVTVPESPNEEMTPVDEDENVTSIPGDTSGPNLDQSTKTVETDPFYVELRGRFDMAKDEGRIMTLLQLGLYLYFYVELGPVLRGFEVTLLGKDDGTVVSLKRVQDAFVRAQLKTRLELRGNEESISSINKETALTISESYFESNSVGQLILKLQEEGINVTSMQLSSEEDNDAINVQGGSSSDSGSDWQTPTMIVLFIIAGGSLVGCLLFVYCEKRGNPFRGKLKRKSETRALYNRDGEKSRSKLGKSISDFTKSVRRRTSGKRRASSRSLGSRSSQSGESYNLSPHKDEFDSSNFPRRSFANETSTSEFGGTDSNHEVEPPMAVPERNQQDLASAVSRSIGDFDATDDTATPHDGTKRSRFGSWGKKSRRGSQQQENEWDGEETQIYLVPASESDVNNL